MSLDLVYAALRWDEMPHLYGGLLLSRGQFQGYLIESSRYPPVLDVFIALFFKIFGASVVSGRLVPLTFGLLSIWTVFEIAYRFYGPMDALLSGVMLASMPGFIWLCRLALLETTLLFFFSLSLLLFFMWMKTNKIKILVMSILALGTAIFVKYNALVGGLVMLVSVFFVWRQPILTKLGKFKISKFSIITLALAAIVLAWVFFAYRGYLSDFFGSWLYVLQVGNTESVAYSTRFPAPIFYLVEMTYPYTYIHPISLPIYVLALAGLGLWLWRRKYSDKFGLVWFFVVYIFFTLIPNKGWRYITLVFPILAVSASVLILFIWNETKKRLKTRKISLPRVNATRIISVAFMFLVAGLLFYSSNDAFLWVQKDHFYVPTREASQYVAEHSGSNANVTVLCATNDFNMYMVKFYLQLLDSGQIALWQYPGTPVDSYATVFNVTELIENSTALNVKYLLLYEYGNNPYFESTLTSREVLEILTNSSMFVREAQFGSDPRRIWVISFLSPSNDMYQG